MVISEIDVRGLKDLAEAILNLIEDVRKLKIRVLPYHGEQDDQRMPELREIALERVTVLRREISALYDLLSDNVARYRLFVDAYLQLFRNQNLREGVQFEFPGCRYALTAFELLPAVGDKFILATGPVQPTLEIDCDECVFWTNRLNSIRENLKRLPRLDIDQWRVDLEREFHNVLSWFAAQDFAKEPTLDQKLAVPEQLRGIASGVYAFGSSYSGTLIRIHPLMKTGAGTGPGMICNWQLAERHRDAVFASDLKELLHLLGQLYFGTQMDVELTAEQFVNRLNYIADQIETKLQQSTPPAEKTVNQVSSSHSRKRKVSPDYQIAVEVHKEFSKFSESFLAANPMREKAMVKDGFCDWVKEHTDLPQYPAKKLQDLNRKGSMLLKRLSDTDTQK